MSIAERIAQRNEKAILGETIPKDYRYITNITNSHDLRRVVRQPYVWPGGYALFLIVQDGEALCMDCVKANYKRVLYAVRNPGHDPEWQPVAADPNWEDQNMYCAHCGGKIPPQYGDDDETDAICD